VSDAGNTRQRPGQAREVAITPTLAEANNNRQRTSYERLSQARETLGVRSETRIQREITQTEAAYKRLAASGTLSAAEQARALEATTRKVTSLTNEMGRLTAAQDAAARSAARQAATEERIQAAVARTKARADQVQATAQADAGRGHQALQTGGAVVAGVAAGAYTLREPMRQAMGFDERLAHMANTAYRERDATGRRLGMGELRAAIDAAQVQGGGTRDGAAEALDALMAKNAMTPAEAIQFLPTITKAASAANTNPVELANIGLRAMQNLKIAPQDMPNVLNMALAGGQAGGFELRDMSKWLPQQMAAATMSGLSGKVGFAKLVALNQAATITAGNETEAGNNVVNLLAKINSEDAATNAKKLGVDLRRYLAEQRGRGVDSIDAFGALVNKTVAARPDYQAFQAELKSGKTDDERRAALEGMSMIAQGAGVGALIQDRQALMALLGMMNNSAYMQTVLGEVRAADVRSGGAVDRNFEVVSGTDAYRSRQREEAVKAAEQAALANVSGGKLNDAIAGLAQRFPALTGSATLAATALAAAAGAAGLFALTAGGGKGGGFATAAGRAMQYLPSGKSLGVAGVAGGAAMLGDAALGAVAGPESAITRYGSSALNGAAIGATLGSMVPVLGTAIGGAIGGVLGLSIQGFKDAFVTPEAPKLQADIKLSVSNDGVAVTRSDLRASGMDATLTTDTGSIWQGAM
jgi:hypothetical protein